MKSRYRIFYWVGGSLLALAGIVLVVVLCLDGWITSVVDRQLRAEAEAHPEKQFGYSDVDVRLLQGTFSVDSLWFAVSLQQADAASGTPCDTIRFSADRIELSGIRPLRTLRRKCLALDELTFTAPRLTAAMHLRKQPQAGRPDTAVTNDIAGQILPYINRITLEDLIVEEGSVSFASLDDKMQLAADSICLGLHDFSLNLADSALAYNDSVYHIDLSRLHLLSGDGLFALDINRFFTRDAGGLSATGIHARNTVGKLQLADRQGKVPTTWADAHIVKLGTSPVNLIRQAVSGEVRLDSAGVETSDIHILRDMRYKAKVPFPMPQEGIMQIPVPLSVGKITADLPKLQVEMATASDRVGALQIRQTKAVIGNLSNAAGNKTTIQAVCRMGEQAEGSFRLNLQNDKACHYSADLQFRNAKGTALDPLLLPIGGAQVRIDLHSLKCSMSGDSKEATGDFQMLYDSLHVFIHRDQMPVAMVAKHANTINFFLGMLLPQSNPRQAGREPIQCKVSAVRDPMQDYAMYLFAPVIDGVIQTVLPPLLQSEVKKSFNKKQQK
ncbi:MAG: hypothetical protein IJV55_06040 [Paludibacteraceae bacterium]|nr:hypothetical protein [Paludibacteraceae bacterium]